MRAARRHRLVIVMFLILAIVFSDCMPMQVHAETTLEKLEKAKQEKNKTENAKNSTQEQKNALQITQNSLLGKLGSLNDELATISGNLQDLEHQIEDKESEITNTQAELEQAKIEEEKQYDAMKLRIQYAYENGNVGVLDSIFTSSDLSDMVNKSEYVDQVYKYDKNMLAELISIKDTIDKCEQALKEELDDVEVRDLKANWSNALEPTSGIYQQITNDVTGTY